MCTILVGFYQILLLQKLDFEIFFIYPFFAVFIAYLLYRERSPSSKDVSENEELNLQNALEIHDNLTQIMFSANTMIATLPQLLEKKPENANTYLKNLKQFTNDVMASLQLLEFELNPALLEQTELSILLKYLGDSVRSGENIEFNYIILDRIMLNDGRHKYVYRIVQEALKNAVTHANTSKIEIKLMRVNQLFEVTIYDNGIGFDSKLQLEEQSGIQLMRRYARLSNTELEITSPVGDGTSVKLRG
jgi:NarL family two-component system sensor histidine kinase LiaS